MNQRVLDAERPLAGRHVVTTRDRPGRLDRALARLGADAINVPMIAIEPPSDGGAELGVALTGLGEATWLVVTSQHGARAVGASALEFPDIRLAAVGSTTADVLAALAGRAVDVVPASQTGADLVASMPSGSGRVVVAQADRADDVVATGLRSLGYDVEVVTAYRTTNCTPSAAARRAVRDGDAVAFASGSACESWVAAFGSGPGPLVVAIGPSTATVARSCGLRVDRVATAHDVDGLVDAVIAALT